MPGGGGFGPASFAGGNSTITLARISAWRLRSSGVAGRSMRLNFFLTIGIPGDESPLGFRDFVGRHRIYRVFINSFEDYNDVTAGRRKAENARLSCGPASAFALGIGQDMFDILDRQAMFFDVFNVSTRF